MNWKDFTPKFKFEINWTFPLHIIREFLITFSVAIILMLLAYTISYLHSVELILGFSIGLSLGINTAWEWQDGLLNDKFNIADWLVAGADIVTVHPKFIGGMIVHPYTKETVQMFLRDAASGEKK